MRFRLYWTATAAIALQGSVPKVEAGASALPAYADFAVAGLSGMTAWLAIHPGDVVKTRMQMGSSGVQGPSPLQMASKILHDEGAQGLYQGLSAALARQACYTTLRLGLYDVMAKHVLASLKDRNLTSGESAAIRLLVAVSSGAVAAFINCPIEVCLVRMQVDGRLPTAQRRNYRHVGHALVSIARQEGILSYWTGASITVIRAMVVSVTQIATYDQAKALLSTELQGFSLHLAAGLIAALTFTALSMPFDTVKSRIQASSSSSSKAAATTNPPQGIIGTFHSIVRNEGVTQLWSGYLPYLVAKGVLTVLLFLIKEQYTMLAEHLLVPAVNRV